MKKNDAVLQRGDKIGNVWRVIDKLGEGGCGVVFSVKNMKTDVNFAMKIEMLNVSQIDQLLKTEAIVLQKLKFSKYVPTFLCFGRTPSFRLLVMERLGNSLNDVRYAVPDRRLSVNTVLRIGVQILQAIRDLHRIWFVHRDIKPANLALGMPPNHQRIYLFDFGLARSLLAPNETKRLRKERTSVAFRGTVSYCSPNVHKGMEHGRHDDLWSMMYVCIELIVGKLPWNRMHRKKAFFFKEFISDKTLLQGCPKKFVLILNYIRSLCYLDHPDYDAIARVFNSCIVSRGVSFTDPFDWEIFLTTQNDKHVSCLSTNRLKPPLSKTPVLSTSSVNTKINTNDVSFNTLTFSEQEFISCQNTLSLLENVTQFLSMPSLFSLFNERENKRESKILLSTFREKTCCSEEQI